MLLHARIVIIELKINFIAVSILKKVIDKIPSTASVWELFNELNPLKSNHFQ